MSALRRAPCYEEAMATARRYDLPPYTRGWFQVGWSRELAIGDVTPVNHFGEQLVMFRGDDGHVGVLDATCPHLGANLACGGVVRESCVVCPYHNWAFDRGGVCTDIPHALKIPPNARVHAWPVVERYGMIFVYRDRARSAPPYALPEIEDFDEARWSRPSTYTWRVAIHSQDIMENSVDSAHFAAVHGHKLPVNTFTAEGKELRISQQTEVRRLGLNIRTKLEFHMIEPGFHYLRFRDTPGTQAMVFSSITPVDEERVDHRLTIFVMKTRIPGWTWLLQRFLVSQMMATYVEDMQIWQNKAYLSRPVLCSYDSAIMKLRNWYAQFYEATSS
jgi:phenylpropionate dioxygenase-like ring-hydroxylating dioxygenase large terminal subunit